MYDNLKPKTLEPKEAKDLVTLHNKGLIRILPQKCCVLLIKGSMDDQFLMSLARKYKDASWIYPKQNEITFKFLLDARTRDLFNGVCIFTVKEMVNKFAGKIYTSGLVFIPRREKDRMLRGLSYIRAGEATIYLSTGQDDGEILGTLAKIERDVKEAVNKGFEIWSNHAATKDMKIDGIHEAFMVEGEYIIQRRNDAVEVLRTTHLFDFLYNIYILHREYNEPAGDETYALGA